MIRATGIEEQVCLDIAHRQIRVINKYGMSVANNPAALLESLQHAYEEVLALSVSLKRVIVGLQNEREVAHPFAFGEIKLNTSTMKLEYRGRHVLLTRTEYAVMLKLIRAQGRVVRYKAFGLLPQDAAVWIYHIRKKLKKAGLDKSIIQTVRGEGYRLKSG